MFSYVPATILKSSSVAPSGMTGTFLGLLTTVAAFTRVVGFFFVGGAWLVTFFLVAPFAFCASAAFDTLLLSVTVLERLLLWLSADEAGVCLRLADFEVAVAVVAVFFSALFRGAMAGGVFVAVVFFSALFRGFLVLSMVWVQRCVKGGERERTRSLCQKL